MGMFSFITGDTHDRIWSNAPNEGPIYMLDNKGNVWVENDYEGYGNFGGKDFDALLANMNGIDTGNDENDRIEGIALRFGNSNHTGDGVIAMKHGVKVPVLTYNKNAKWIDTAPPSSCPDQGWAPQDNEY